MHSTENADLEQSSWKGFGKFKGIFFLYVYDIFLNFEKMEKHVLNFK